MDRFHQMRVFSTVAEEEGFAPAAKRLGLSPPAVTRAISALEERLGIKLLNRTTRFVRTTEAGDRYLEDIRRILDDVAAAEEAAIGINATPSGDLSVTAPMFFGRRFVMPGIVDYLQRYPETRVSAVFLDRIVNLLEEGFDVGVRLGELPDSTMRARNVGEVRAVTVAAPSYLQAHGTPKTLADLRNHSLLSFGSGQGPQNWRYMEKGEPTRIRVVPRLLATTNDAVLNAAVLGFGVARMISYQIAPELEAGSLTLILEEFEPEPIPVQIIHREGRVQSAKVRTFVDLMAERLRAEPALCRRR